MGCMGEPIISEKDHQFYKTPYHDFKQFTSCFGSTKIMPTDIDFMVERNGCFLVMEFKPEGKIISLGQDIMLKKLSAVPNFSVVLAYHKPCNRYEDKEFTSMKIYPSNKFKKITSADIVQFVNGWFNTVSSKS